MSRVRPLRGWSVAVARDEAPDDDVSARFKEQGAIVVPLRLMKIEPLPVAEEAAAGEFDFVCFCSKNAVDAVAVVPKTQAIAAVGEATAQHLRARGVSVDVVGTAGGAALGKLLVERGVRKKRVLLPRAQGGNDDLKVALEAAGAEVVAVDVYRSVPVPVDRHALLLLQTPRALVVTSPQRAASLLERVTVPENFVVIAIGATTAAALREKGARVDVVSDAPTPEELAAALARLQAR